MSPSDNREAPVVGTRATPQISTSQANNCRVADLVDISTGAAIASQQVSRWDVHEFVAPTLAAAGSSPMIGRPANCPGEGYT
jgi:uncharacterized protein DUF2742